MSTVTQVGFLLLLLFLGLIAFPRCMPKTVSYMSAKCVTISACCCVCLHTWPFPARRPTTVPPSTTGPARHRGPTPCRRPRETLLGCQAKGESHVSTFNTPAGYKGKDERAQRQRSKEPNPARKGRLRSAYVLMCLRVLQKRQQDGADCTCRAGRGSQKKERKKRTRRSTPVLISGTTTRERNSAKPTSKR